MGFIPDRVTVEEAARAYPLTSRVLKNLEGVPVESIASAEQVRDRVRASDDPVGVGKRSLLLAVSKGRFVKPCPCTPGHVGCGYAVINLHLNCPLDCAYCILQGYLTNPALTVYVNLDDLWAELDAFLASAGPRAVRIGTGELGDSLALDLVTGNSADLMDYFRGKPGAVLELKTKTTNIQNILRAEPAENIVVSWSLNSVRAAEADERDAPSMAERLAAAARVQGHGFRVGFHFDPLVRYAGWQEDYSRVIRDLFQAVDPARVAWVSLGSLRFAPGLKPLILKRHPGTRLFFEELIRGTDGKFRYFRPLRTELYRFVLDEILQAAGRVVPAYLCMESVEVWGDVFKKNPGGKAALGDFLSSRP